LSWHLRGHHRGSRSHSPDSNAVNPCLTASDSPAQAARLHLVRRLPGPSPFLRPARSRRDQREWHQVKGLRETSALGAAQQPPGTATRSAAAVLNPARRSPGRSRTHTPHREPAAADRGALRAERGTGRSARFSRRAKHVSQPRRFGDLAAPNIFRPSRRATQPWCQIQLTITTVMHTDSLPRITTRVGNALLSACERAVSSVGEAEERTDRPCSVRHGRVPAG
jgi:hypothetical protein